MFQVFKEIKINRGHGSRPQRNYRRMSKQSSKHVITRKQDKCPDTCRVSALIAQMREKLMLPGGEEVSVKIPPRRHLSVSEEADLTVLVEKGI